MILPELPDMPDPCEACDGTGKMRSGVMLVRRPEPVPVGAPLKLGPPVILVHPERMKELRALVPEDGQGIQRVSSVSFGLKGVPVYEDRNVPLTCECSTCGGSGVEVSPR